MREVEQRKVTQIKETEVQRAIWRKPIVLLETFDDFYVSISSQQHLVLPSFHYFHAKWLRQVCMMCALQVKKIERHWQPEKNVGGETKS